MRFTSSVTSPDPGCARALIVTDPILEKAGLLERVRRPLQAAGLEVAAFTGGEPEPSMKAGIACHDRAKTFAPDVLVGLGGGSNMDLAKIAARRTAMAAPRRLRRRRQDSRAGLPAHLRADHRRHRFGSLGRLRLTDTENHIKVGILSN